MVQSLKNSKVVSMFKTLFFISFFTLLFVGCSSKTVQQTVQLPPQNSTSYEHNFKTLAPTIQKQNLYEKHFSIWQQKSITLSYEEATWGKKYATQGMYGMNYQPLSSSWFKTQTNNAHFENFSRLNQKAITIKNTNLRVFPTHEPLFYNPFIVGEGFPFDYNQNSGIKINTPIMISHFSKDRAWAYVQSSFASGFIPVRHLALVDDTIIKAFEQSSYYVAIKDNVPIYKNNQFKEYIKLGTIFPKSKYGNFFVINQHHDLSGYIQTIDIPKDALVKQSLDFNASNIKHVIDELIGEPYGWGEAFLKRDCSALTKDYFAAFGVHLNRNSSQQIQNGHYTNIKHLSNEDKKAFIVKHAKAFQTLLYLKGHIMLYVGASKKGEPLAFHNMWGVRTSYGCCKQGRSIVGKAIISTLEVGKELTHFDAQHALLSKIEGMVIIE
jgi:hypothetical protein